MAGTMPTVSPNGSRCPIRLNGVRPRWPEQLILTPPKPTSNKPCLNGVRPRWPEQFHVRQRGGHRHSVSMESGLDGRNNLVVLHSARLRVHVSMESGLDGRNNWREALTFMGITSVDVSMESGLDGRNNARAKILGRLVRDGLNGVRPRWPEQFIRIRPGKEGPFFVSQWSPA